jgi:hypothetical protein
VSAYRYEQERRVVVATTRTPAEAEMIKMTLAAHGYQATVSASFAAHPSVDFVEGLRVQVMAADEEAVRELLRKLRLTGDDPPA